METYQTKGLEQLGNIDRQNLLLSNMLRNERLVKEAYNLAEDAHANSLEAAKLGAKAKSSKLEQAALAMRQRAGNTQMLFNIINRERDQTPAVSYSAKLEDVALLRSGKGLPSRTESYLAAYEVDVLQQGFLEKGLADSLRSGGYEIALIMRPRAIPEYHSLGAEFLKSFTFEGLKPYLQDRIRIKVATNQARKNKKLLMKKGIGANIQDGEVLGVIASEAVIGTEKFERMARENSFGDMPVVTNTGKMVFITPNGCLRY